MMMMKSMNDSTNMEKQEIGPLRDTGSTWKKEENQKKEEMRNLKEG